MRIQEKKPMHLFFMMLASLVAQVLFSSEFYEAEKRSYEVKNGLIHEESYSFSEQLWADGHPSVSAERLFGTDIFIDELWYEKKGVTCLSLSMPNSEFGFELFFKKKAEFDYLLKHYSFHELLSQYIFVPQYSSLSHTFYSCEINVSDTKKSTPLAKFRLRKASQFKSLLALNKNSLFHLLHCVLKGAYFLEENGYFINSLSLESILHLGSKKDFLLTDYSHSSSNKQTQNFAAEIRSFLKNFLDIYSYYMNSISGREFSKQKLVLEAEKRIQELRQAFLNKEHSITKEELIKLEERVEKKIEEIKTDRKHYNFCADHPLIKAVKRHLVPLAAKSELKASELYRAYQLEVLPLITESLDLSHR